MSLAQYLLDNFAHNFKNAITGYAVYDYYSPSLDKLLIVITLGLLTLILLAQRTMGHKPKIELSKLLVEAQTAIDYDDLELAKHRYLQIMTIYNKLSDVEKAKFYPLVMEIYNERRSKEQLFM